MIQKEYRLRVFKFLRVYIKSMKKISRTNEVAYNLQSTLPEIQDNPQKDTK